MRYILPLLISALLVGCAPVEHTAEITQPVGRQLVAGPGDLLVHVDLQRNLTNAFGRADIFGRKTDEGFADLYFSGVEPDGTVVLYRKGATIVTNETTMSRTPISESFGSVHGNVVATGNTANLNAYGTTTTIHPASDYHVVVPTDALAIRLRPGTRDLPFEGYTVEILSTSPTSLNYQVSRNPG